MVWLFRVDVLVVLLFDFSKGLAFADIFFGVWFVVEVCRVGRVMRHGGTSIGVG